MQLFNNRCVQFDLSVKNNISLHSNDTQFFLKVIDSHDTWLTQTVRQGLVIPFYFIPSQYQEDNNISALNNWHFVTEQIDKLAKKGSVSRVDYIPKCVNPLSVASKNGKKRLVLDLSRKVNNMVRSPYVRLEDYSYFRFWVKEDDLLSSFDLEAMYHQLHLHESYKTFFGFSLPQRDGSPHYYVYNVLPFGLNFATYVVNRVMLPLKNLFRDMGIKLAIYVDDGLIIHSCARHAPVVTDFVIKVFQMGGWKINFQKSQLQPCKRLTHLGFIIDTTEFMIFAQHNKIQHVINVISNLSPNQPIKNRDLAKLLGEMTAMLLPIGRLVRILSRSSQHCLALSVLSVGWEGTTIVNTRILSELNLFKSIVKQANGVAISSNSRKTFVVSSPQTTFYFASDASAKYAYIFNP